MKNKTAKIEWYVLYYNINSRKLESINIISRKLIEDVYKQIKSGKITNKSNLREYLRKEFMYRYWSKSEYEILVTDWPPVTKKIDKESWVSEKSLTKIDIYDQIKDNLDNITDLFILKMDIKFNK